MRLFIGKVGTEAPFEAMLKVGDRVEHGCFACTRVRRDRLEIEIAGTGVQEEIIKPADYSAGDDLRFTVNGVAWRISLTRHLQKSERTYTLEMWRSSKFRSFDGSVR